MSHGERKQKVYDDYFTPKEAWELVSHFIPDDKVIWECFYGNGDSAKHLAELQKRVISINSDFFDDTLVPPHDLCCSNPPFSKTKEIILKLIERGKPFMMIMPPNRLSTAYMIDAFAEEEEKIQVIIPRKRIPFIKADPETKIILPKDEQPKQGLKVYFYCWKMGLPRDLNYV